MSYDTNMKSIYANLEEKVDNLVRLNPESFPFTTDVSEEEFYISAYKNLETKHRALRGRYSFLLFKLKLTAPKTYETFKDLETNDV